jgi:predicted secreted Zn-dependent protease
MENLVWRKASKSGNQGQCVEVATVANGVLVRDSKNPTGPVLSFTEAEWDAFLDGARKGEFDL